MIRPSAFKTTITVYRRFDSGDTTEYGDVIWEDDPGTDYPANVYPTETRERELDELRETRIQTYQVLCNPDVDLEGIDRVVWLGRSHEVLGEPLQLVGRGDAVHHQEFIMREIVG